MKRNKLFELLFSLSRHEKSEFNRYLASPFFNSDKTLGKAFGFLLAQENQPGIPKQELFTHIYGHSQVYNDKKIRYIGSNLQKHLENYITLKRFSNDKAHFRNVLCQELNERQCEKAFAFQTLLVKGEKNELDADYYYQSYFFSKTGYLHSAKTISRIQQQRFEDMSEKLDRYYCLRKLQLASELVNMNNVLQSDVQLLMTTETIELSRKQQFFNSPLIEIYLRIYELLKDSSGESFSALRKLVSVHENKISIAELKDIYQYIKNFCVKKINTGQPEFLRILFDIYKETLSNERLMKDDYFSTWEFKNLVTIALRLNEAEWTKVFIQKYLTYLAPADRKNAGLYNLAVLFFYLGDYRKSIQNLQEVEFTDVYYALDSRSFLLKNYYELDETETMLYHISAYKIFLKRNKVISTYQRTIYSNYMKYVAKLIRAGINRKKLQSLKLALEKEQAISDKRWLMEKIEQLS